MSISSLEIAGASSVTSGTPSKYNCHAIFSVPTIVDTVRVNALSGYSHVCVKNIDPYIVGENIHLTLNDSSALNTTITSISSGQTCITSLASTANPGDTSISVNFNGNFTTEIAYGELISITCNNGQIFNTTVVSISSNTITIANAIPSLCNSSNTVGIYIGPQVGLNTTIAGGKSILANSNIKMDKMDITKVCSLGATTVIDNVNSPSLLTQQNIINGFFTPFTETYQHNCIMQCCYAGLSAELTITVVPVLS